MASLDALLHSSPGRAHYPLSMRSPIHTIFDGNSVGGPPHTAPSDSHCDTMDPFHCSDLFETSSHITASFGDPEYPHPSQNETLPEASIHVPVLRDQQPSCGMSGLAVYPGKPINSFRHPALYSGSPQDSNASANSTVVMSRMGESPSSQVTGKNGQEHPRRQFNQRGDKNDVGIVNRRRSSRFRGVTKHRRSGRWEAHIWIKDIGRQVYLGGYDNEQHAAEAYDVAAIKCKGKRVKTNFEITRWDFFHVPEGFMFFMV